MRNHALPGSVITSDQCPLPQALRHKGTSGREFPGGGMWSSWHVPEATYCALASSSCPGLSGTSRVGDAGPATVVDSPRLQESPDPGSPPLSSANLDPRSPREEALGATSIAAAGAPGSPDSSPSRPSRDSAFLAVGQEQTCRRPPATLPDTPPTPGARGRAAGERSDERWRRGGRRGRKKINHRATLTYQLPGHLGALLGHGPLGAGNVAGPTLIYGPHPPPTLSVS